MIILHCSATRAGQRYTFRQCRQDHRARGYKDIGYHYYVSRDGQVHEGRPLWQQGAHCLGHNRHSIGICYEGLVQRLHDQFPQALILGHRDLSPDLDGNGRIEPREWVKQCPSFDASLDYEDLQPTGMPG